MSPDTEFPRAARDLPEVSKRGAKQGRGTSLGEPFRARFMVQGDCQTPRLAGNTTYVFLAVCEREYTRMHCLWCQKLQSCGKSAVWPRVFGDRPRLSITRQEKNPRPGRTRGAEANSTSVPEIRCVIAVIHEVNVSLASARSNVLTVPTIQPVQACATGRFQCVGCGRGLVLNLTGHCDCRHNGV